jgi:DNA primase
MPDQVLQDIKDRVDIAEVIGGYIQLKKSGANFKAPCPFHNEKSPSLMISTSKQIWHCFGCGEGGDIFGFVMKYENIEFREALKLLAAKAGVKLPEYKPVDRVVIDQQEQLFKINDFAARFYHELLLKDKRAEGARGYLKKRGLTAATIEQWKIGFAPDEFHALEQALSKKKVSIQDMVAAGVSAKNERGQIYDRFRGRITFPIFNTLGAVVGFSARILPEKELPDKPVAKYINSPETPIYSKGKVLFGFNFAKTGIRKADEIIIVEGQMDCISAHQAGITNVVASSGTALTPDQLMQVARFTRVLKFCFDADGAGLIATKRAVVNYLGKDFTLKIIDLTGAQDPTIKDPDDLIRKNPKEFVRQVAAAQLFLDYYFTKQFQDFHHSFEEKKRIENELLPLLALLSDPLEQDHYIKILADKLGTTPHVLLEALHLIKLPKNNPVKSAVLATPIQPAGVNALEKQVLGGMLLYPEFKKFVTEKGNVTDFTHPESRTVAEQLFGGSSLDENNFLAKEAIFMVESQLAEMDGGEAALERELKKVFALLRLNAIKQEQKQVHDSMKDAETEKVKDRLNELNQKFALLSKLRMEFEKLL